jgi:hypothetical protein
MLSQRLPVRALDNLILTRCRTASLQGDRRS